MVSKFMHSEAGWDTCSAHPQQWLINNVVDVWSKSRDHKWDCLLAVFEALDGYAIVSTAIDMRMHMQRRAQFTPYLVL